MAQIPVTADYNNFLTTFSVLKPDKQVALFRSHGDQGAGVNQMIRMMGWEKEATQDSFSHFEDNWKIGNFEVKTEVASPGAGNASVITLAATDLDSSNNFYPQAKDIVTFANEVQGYIYSVDVTTPTAPIVTIYPCLATENIGLLAAGAKVIVTSNTNTEGSDQRSGRAVGFDEITGYCQIIKSDMKFTGSEMVRALYFDRIQDQAGTFQGILPLGMHDLDMRHNFDIDGALLTGKTTTNTNLTGVVTTGGLIPFIRTSGTTAAVAAGSLTLDHLYTAASALIKNYGPMTYMMACGLTRYQEVEKLLSAEIIDTGADQTEKVFNDQLFKGNQSLGLTFNFKYLQLSNMHFGIKLLHCLHNPQLYGISGFKYVNHMLLLPLGTTRDAKSSEKVPYIGMRARALGSYKRKWEAWSTGSAGPGPKTNEGDYRKFHIRSHIGAEQACGNMFYMVYAA